MRLILTRHGETIENAQGIIHGQLPGQLSEKGMRQAEALGKRLAEERVEHIYTSDLRRAKDTATYIAEYHLEATFTLLEDLREQHLGSWQGVVRAELIGRGEAGMHRKALPEDGESFEALYARSKRVIELLQEKHPDDVVVLVGHSRVNRALVAALRGLSHEELYDIPGQPNAGVSIFEITPEGVTSLLENCARHTEGL